jgi:hypothetical protein
VVVFGATDASVGNGNFVGLGTSSSNFFRCTTVVPMNATISNVTFSVRDLVAASPVTITLYTAPSGSVGALSTGLTCTVPTLGSSCTAAGLYSVSAGDLISGLVNTSGAISNGVTWSATLAPQ